MMKFLVTSMVSLLVLAATISSATAAAQCSANNLLLPRYDSKTKAELKYAGKTYEEWANYFWIWESGFNKTKDPLTDLTGERANQNQPSGMFLLSLSPIEAPVNRYITVPQNSFVYGTLYTSLVGFSTGNPSNQGTTIAYLKKVIGTAGVAIPANPTLANLWSLAAKLACTNTIINTTATIDGCKVNPFQEGLIYTKPGHGFKLKPNYYLVGNPADNFNSVQCSYAGILKPFKKGKHTVSVSESSMSNSNTKFWNNPPFFQSSAGKVQITYHITVV